MAKINTVKTAKTGKVLKDVSKPAAPAVVLPTHRALFDAGQAIGTAERGARLLLAQYVDAEANGVPVTEEMRKAVRNDVVAGYMFEREHGSIAATDEQLAHYLALVLGTSAKSATEKEGKLKRTDEQERAFEAGKQRFSRAARAVGFEQAGKNAGNTSNAGANKRKEETPDAEPVTPAAPAVPAAEPAAPVEVKDKGGLLNRVHEVSTAIKGLTPTAKKVLADSAELQALYLKAQAAWLELEAVLARSPK